MTLMFIILITVICVLVNIVYLNNQDRKHLYESLADSYKVVRQQEVVDKDIAQELFIEILSDIPGYELKMWTDENNGYIEFGKIGEHEGSYMFNYAPSIGRTKRDYIDFIRFIVMSKFRERENP